MRKAVGYLGALLIVLVLIVGFLVYFVRSFDPSLGAAYDGLGRPLSSAPWFMRLFFGADADWAGWGWFFGDMAVFWGGLLGGGVLAQFGFKIQSETARQP